MKNKYVISSLTALSAIYTAFCDHGIKNNVQYFEQIGIGVHVMHFLGFDEDNLFGASGSIQGYLARNNSICGMLDVYAAWIKQPTFAPSFPLDSKQADYWDDSAGLKGYVFDGDIAIGKDFCPSEDKTMRHHSTKEHDLYSRIAMGIYFGSRKISFKNIVYFPLGLAYNTVLLKVSTHSLFVGAKCKMMYPMDNALVIFDIKAGPVVYGKGEYVGQSDINDDVQEKIKTDHIGAEVKAGFSAIQRMSDNDFGIGMKISVDYNYRTEEVRESKSATSEKMFVTTVGQELDGAFSNNIIGTIEFVFGYSTV